MQDLDDDATNDKPLFQAIQETAVEKQQRKVRVPPNRVTPLKKDWEHIYTPIVEKMNLQIRMNPKLRVVELRV